MYVLDHINIHYILMVNLIVLSCFKHCPSSFVLGPTPCKLVMEQDHYQMYQVVQLYCQSL